jgi:hypothetical protein
MTWSPPSAAVAAFVTVGQINQPRPDQVGVSMFAKPRIRTDRVFLNLLLPVTVLAPAYCPTVHSRVDPSYDVVARVAPSGEKATLSSPLLCPIRV